MATVVSERRCDLCPFRVVGDDDDASALAEAARRRAADHADDALDLLLWKGIGLEGPVHPALRKDLAELHAAHRIGSPA